MQPQLCSRCKKNIAVVFITRQENGQNVNEGLCLKCAKNLGLPQVDEMMRRMGITDEDLDNISNEMMGAFGGAENLEGLTDADDPAGDDEEDGKTATFPFLSRFFGGSPAASDAPAGDSEQTQSPRSGKKVEKGSKHKFLDSYCINLSQRARDGKLDAVIGRAEEIERVIQILNRRQKNNPCLIGEPGVGKTAIAEGLAQCIVAGEVPFKLRSKEVYLLDLTALVAGTQFRGQFESRMKGLIEEIRKMGNVILVIDEVHNIVGAGDAEGSMNAANILKPALSRGEVQVIGATTFNEYRKHIEKDSALERRFQPVKIEEPSVEDTVAVLTGIKEYYEKYHGVTLSEGIIRQAVTLSERYINDRFLPDKAIDLLDESCACAALRNKAADRFLIVKKDMDTLGEELEELESETENPDFERIATVKTELAARQKESDELKEKVKQSRVTEDDLAKVIELWTGIPAAKIKQSDIKRLKGLEQRLKEKIIGQDEAVELVARAVRRSRVQISARRRPASFIFAGPTGVGKTELVKVLSKELFDTPETLIRLDMSEFMEKHSVSRIIGSPPGYVGYDEAGQLTEKVRRKPYSVILFDEIEKAHPDVMNILLQILDDGHITDAHGRNVSFENTVIIMTTNAGSQTGGSSLGFGQSVSQMSADKTMKALKSFLRPEFIGRVDEVVCFNPLALEDFEKIAGLMLSELKEPLAEKGYSFEWDDEVQKSLAKEAFGGTRGARDLRNAVRRKVEDKIASAIIDNCDEKISGFKLDTDGIKVVK